MSQDQFYSNITSPHDQCMLPYYNHEISQGNTTQASVTGPNVQDQARHESNYGASVTIDCSTWQTPDRTADNSHMTYESGQMYYKGYQQMLQGVQTPPPEPCMLPCCNHRYTTSTAVQANDYPQTSISMYNNIESPVWKMSSDCNYSSRSIQSSYPDPTSHQPTPQPPSEVDKEAVKYKTNDDFITIICDPSDKDKPLYLKMQTEAAAIAQRFYLPSSENDDIVVANWISRTESRHNVENRV